MLDGPCERKLYGMTSKHKRSHYAFRLSTRSITKYPLGLDFSLHASRFGIRNEPPCRWEGFRGCIHPLIRS